MYKALVVPEGQLTSANVRLSRLRAVVRERQDQMQAFDRGRQSLQGGGTGGWTDGSIGAGASYSGSTDRLSPTPSPQALHPHQHQQQVHVEEALDDGSGDGEFVGSDSGSPAGASDGGGTGANGGNDLFSREGSVVVGAAGGGLGEREGSMMTRDVSLMEHGPGGDR